MPGTPESTSSRMPGPGNWKRAIRQQKRRRLWLEGGQPQEGEEESQEDDAPEQQRQEDDGEEEEEEEEQQMDYDDPIRTPTRKEWGTDWYPGWGPPPPPPPPYAAPRFCNASKRPMMCARHYEEGRIAYEEWLIAQIE
jgi:hypothetical protein